MTTLTWHGHSTFEINVAGKSVLFDPFFTGNPAAKMSADDVKPDAVLVSHGHGDHVGDAVAIAKRTSALFVSNYEIVEWAQKQGVENAHPMHIGGSHKFEFGTVKLTIAHHGSALPDGSNGGNPTGILLKLSGGTIYFAGDTGLFYDMKLIGEEGIDTAILPIGDNFTMGPDDSIRAIKLLEPKSVVPMHYNTWPLIEQDVDAWAERVSSETSATPIVPSIGTALELFG